MGFRSSCHGANDSITKRTDFISGAQNNAQCHNGGRPATNVRISLVASPSKRNMSNTFLENRGKRSTAGCASLMEDEIEIVAEIDKRQSAVGQIDPCQL